ncbi:MAG: universal stress protein [Phycisphaerales bacterium]|nr:universal stress protein [Phycisphaerales bacterium]
MTNPKIILAATDFSPCSLVALRQAAELATKTGASLHILNVVSEKDVVQVALISSVARGEIESRAIEDSKARLKETATYVLGDIKVELHSVIDHPIDAVIKTIKKINADLLVIGTFGDGGPGRGASAFSTKCARRCPIDVLLVHADWPEKMDSVMACIDFSTYSDKVAQHAAQLATYASAKLKLVHVYSNPFESSRWAGFQHDALDDLITYKDDLLMQLNRIRQRLSNNFPNLTIESELVSGVDYTKAIVARTQKDDIGLVVIGAKGRTKLSYILLGSTTEKVLRDTNNSVLTIRH